MSRPRFSVKTLPQEYCDFAKWRQVDLSGHSPEDKKRFESLKGAIESYIRTGKLAAASSASGFSSQTVLVKLNRCVTLAPDGQLYGWAGLLPGLRLESYARAVPIKNATHSRGYAGCFEKFLKAHEDIRTGLHDLILKRPKRTAFHEARVSIKNIARAFLKLCQEKGIRDDEYPFNTKTKCKRSVARYVSEVTKTNVSAGSKARFGVEAAKKLRVGTGVTGIQRALAPYDSSSLDSHKVDCIGSVIVRGPKGNQAVAIERLWLVIVAEDFSTAVLGYSIGIRTEVSSGVIEQALISALATWRPRTLSVPGMHYREGAGLPSGVIPELQGCFPAVLSLDNAAAHYSKRIAEGARKRLGCGITWGGLGRWEHNTTVERLFKTLEIYGFQRLPSTTGSSPVDTLKDKPIEKATSIGITWDALVELVDVLIANYNATANRGLGGQTPLQVLRGNLELCGPAFLPRQLPPPTVGQPELGITVEARVVRGSQRHGKRPYIEIDRVRYTNAELSNLFGLVGKRVRVHIDEQNMQTVRAFLESGQEVGVLRGMGAWGRTPHSLEMRKLVMTLVDAGELALDADEDPVESLLQHLGKKASDHKERKPKSVSRDATKLANALNVSGLKEIPHSEPPKQQPPLAADDSAMRPLPSTIKSTVWKSVT